MSTLHCRPPGQRATEVRIGPGVRHGLQPALAGRQAFALVDRALASHCPDLANPPWPQHGIEAGEDAKSFAQLEQVLRMMVRQRLDRSAVLVAIGGGTVGDLGGLAASLFLRGVDLVMVPTTLLAMLDSSVGGKTAINLQEGKNLVGTTHPATLVLADLEVLTTLPEREFRSGLGEALKMAIGLHAGLFEFLEQARDRVLARDIDALHEVVRLCIESKIEVVEDDLKETDRRRLLNLGHSLGHALEAHGGWQMAHGLAVARGLYFAIEVAVALGMLEDDTAGRCTDLLASYGYQRDPLPAADDLLPFLLRDKKMQDGLLQMALPNGVGGSETRGVSHEQLRDRLSR